MKQAGYDVQLVKSENKDFRGGHGVSTHLHTESQQFSGTLPGELRDPLDRSSHWAGSGSGAHLKMTTLKLRGI